MNLRQYLTAMATGTAIALSSWAIVVMAIDPVTAGFLAFAVFYITLGSGLVGLLTILGTVVRAGRDENADVGMAVARSFRQAILLALLVILTLYLKGIGVFSTSVLFFLIGGFGLIEFFFLSFQERRQKVG